MNAVDLLGRVAGIMATPARPGVPDALGQVAAEVGGYTAAAEVMLWELTDGDQSCRRVAQWSTGEHPGGGPDGADGAVELSAVAGPRWRAMLADGPTPMPVPQGGSGQRPPLVGTLVPLCLDATAIGAVTLWRDAHGPGSTAMGPQELTVLRAAAAVIAAGLHGLRERERASADAVEARAMLDDVGSVIVRIGPDGRMQFVNKAWTTLTGIGRDDIVGKDAMHHVHPDDRILAAQHLAAVIGGSTEPREVRFLSRAGSARWMEVTGRALFDEQGAMSGFAGILHDVTDRRRSELEAHEARTRAERAQAAAERASQAKTDFLSRMSHELRTPLNAIIGFSELLEGTELAPEDRQSVAQISRAGRHLLDLVTEALDVTRIENGQLPVRIAAVPIGRLVAGCIDLLRPAAAEHDLTVEEVPHEHTELRVLADTQRLRQVMLNLLSNAVKYSHRGGLVSVDCYPLDLETPLGRQAPHGWLRIAVTDTGIGIPPDRLDDVFLPFERIGAERTEVEGTGLGLSLTRGLVEAMQGQITVHSVPGVGTTFRVDLPAAASGEPGQPAPADAAGAGARP